MRHEAESILEPVKGTAIAHEGGLLNAKACGVGCTQRSGYVQHRGAVENEGSPKQLQLEQLGAEAQRVEESLSFNIR
jgi:hypothetical protein